MGGTSRPASAAASPASDEYDVPEENLWQPSQPQRHGKMTTFQARSPDERRVVFEDALERGLTEEGITDPGERERWKGAMRTLVTGQGLPPKKYGENPDLNPFMIAGESGGRAGTADRMNSSALGYFQFLRQHPNGKPYGHEGYLPEEYKRRPYHPVGQVRQFVRAIKSSGRHKGDPMGPVRQKIDDPKGAWGP